MKKLFYTLLIVLLGTNVFAQNDATISASQIKYWVGSGSNEVILAVNWATPDTALAWGYRFSSDSITVAEILGGIANADSRFSFDSSMGQYGAWLQDIVFVPAAGDTLSLTGSYWMYNVNGITAMNSFDLQYVKSGDLVKFGDESVGIITDTVMYTYVWTTAITPVNDPSGDQPVDATISASQIKYWVGSGSNEVILAVNWANPDTALAWGYRFSSDSITVAEILGGIANADSRFSFDSSMGQYGAWLQDIVFVPAAGDTLSLTGSYWMYNVNGISAMNSFDMQYVKSGDLVKFGDESVGIITDTVMYTYVWTTAITPVEAPEAIVRITEMQVNVFPNPAVDFVNISMEENESATLILTDMQGKIVKRGTITGEGTIPVRDLAAGLYLLRLQNDKGIAVRKIQVR